jgi:ATP synthase F1 delta subunit
MSAKSTKTVNLYAKSLYQNINSNLKQERVIAPRAEILTKTKENISKPRESEQKLISTLSLVSYELHTLRSVFLYSKKFLDFYSNPLHSSEKLSILFRLFPNISQTTSGFLEILAKNNHLFLLPEICDEYHRILDKFKKKTQVKIILASIFKKSYANLFLKKVKILTDSKEIIPFVSYNPKLLGGFIIEYNSVIIDTTLLKAFSLFSETI